MTAEDIPQSVVEAAVAAYIGGWFRDCLIAALREYERLGYRLVRYDEATVERMAEAIYRAGGGMGWPAVFPSENALALKQAHAALIAAQGEGRR